MKYLRLFVVYLVIAFPTSAFSHSQRILEEKQFLEYLYKGRYWEMTQFYSKSNIDCPTLKLLNSVYTAIGDNRNDLAIQLIDENMKTHWKEYDRNTQIFSGLMVNLCLTEGRYDDALAQYNWLKDVYSPLQQQYYKNPKITADVNKMIDEEAKVMKIARKRPQMRIVCKGEPKPIKFTLEPHIKTKLKVNETTETFLWDTGSPVAISLPHRYADELDLDYRSDSIVFGNEKIAIAYIDSLMIGNYTLYHVPTCIVDMKSPIPALYKQHASKKKLLEAMNVYNEMNCPIIGLPIIKLFEKFGIDWKYECFFFPKEQLPTPHFEERIFMTNYSRPYLLTPITINSMSMMGSVDTGSSFYMGLNRQYQKDNSKLFPIGYDKSNDIYSVTMVGLQDTLGVFLLNPSLTYGYTAMKPTYLIKLRDSVMTNEPWDVLLGYPFFKSLGEAMVIDFKEMKVKIWEKSDNPRLY